MLQPAPGVVNEGVSSRPSSASRLPAASVAATPFNPERAAAHQGTSMIARVSRPRTADAEWRSPLAKKFLY
ncbi:hypothetical protein [Leptolyngbya sp. O-77]|uniref:hypothetical protein n=1 Tax=Leptolyngbya sp. O-77 TaxID=1080068 RepID=UPI000A6249A8|nr:hypothetical protein [Leptolyngbya sp. O-77]